MNMRYQLGLIFFLCCRAALASDQDALTLADAAPQQLESPSELRCLVEAALAQTFPKNDAAAVFHHRWSVELQLDKTLAPGWRAVLSDRLDLNRQNQDATKNDVNTLKEAYLSWQVGANQILDLGRINAYNGVASGYNPSDFFRAGAVRSLVSIDPVSLKKNRLGSVMLRTQNFWDSGSLTLQFSPKIEEKSNSATFSPDFGATNHENRWLLAVSQKISENINPQWLVYGVEHQPVQLGMNLSTLLGDATVAYFEWAGGRNASLQSGAFSGQGYGQTHGQDDVGFRQRSASGLSYTTDSKLSLTLEYEYNGAGMNSTEWAALRRGSPLAYGRYRTAQLIAQELPTRQELFFYASWQDAWLTHLDLAAMQKLNLADRSRLSWLEARYHWRKADLALQWQDYRGEPTSVYGAAAQKSAWQMSLRYYF